MNIIYCDVDGVFNVYDVPSGHASTHGDNWGDYEQIGAYTAYSRKMVQAFNELVQASEATCVWNTTWEHAAADFGFRIGLNNCDTWEVLAALEHDLVQGEWLKFDSIKEHFERNRPDKAIWIDDELHSSPEAVAWCRANGILVIAPNDLYGISASQMGDIELFLLPDPLEGIESI